MLVDGVGYGALSLYSAPLEVACLWLLSVEHGLRRPSMGACAVLLGARVAAWGLLQSHTGSLAAMLDPAASAWSVPFGGSGLGQGAVVVLLAIGSLCRARDNLPIVEHVGLFGWVLAILLDAPWIFFLCCGYVAAALQGVSHELTNQKGTLNQVHDATQELAHTSYFPALALQAAHQTWARDAAWPATVRDLGAGGDPRSRRALGL